MANKIILKKSSVSGKSPSTGDLEFGELALNYADGKLYYKTSAGTIDYISTSAGGGSSSGNVDIGASFLTRTYTGDGTTTGFTVTNGSTVDSLIVTENGIVQTPGVDYTVAGAAITFTTAPAADVLIQIRELFTGPALESLSVSNFTETGDGTTVTFTLPVSPPNIAHTIVNVDGVVQVRNSAYTLSGADIVFAEPIPNGQDIDITIFEVTTSPITELNVSGNTNLGSIANVTITGGTAGQVITTDGAGNLSFATVQSGGGADLESSTTDDLDEGVANLYFTTPRARESISVTGSLNYNVSTGVISYNQPTGLSAFTNDAGYLQNYTETDPIFTTSAAYGITSINISNWDAAYTWGDHAQEGYLTTETDPVFTASPAGGITSTNVLNWNAAYDWGDHSTIGYLTVESDPVFMASPASSITQGNINNWNIAYDWGNHASAGYLTAETDPVFVASAAYGITTTNISNWDTAYSWGDHAAANYASRVSVSSTAPASPEAGDLWLDSDSLDLYVYYVDGQDAQWIQVNTSAGSASVTVSNTAPAAPVDGELWFNTTSNALLVYSETQEDWVVTAESGIALTDLGAVSMSGITYNSSTGEFSLSNIPNSSLTNSAVTINGQSISLGSSGVIDTDDVAEGTTNLYYTTTRANADIDARVTKSFVESLGIDSTTLDGFNSSDFATAAQGALADSAVQPGDNISVLINDADYATESYVNTAVANLVDTAPATLDTLNELAAALGDDPNFATTVATSIGSKLNTADFNSTADTWLAGKSTTNVAEGTNLYYTEARVNTAFDTRLALKTTSDLTEGTNLYYTNARFDTRLALKTTSDLAEGTNLYYTNARVNSAFDTRLALKTTSDLAEGTNLYYTDARFDARLALKNTDDIDEGSSNLYYTNARFDTRLALKTTSDLAEGTNLYYTAARANSAIDARVTKSFVEALGIETVTSLLDLDIVDGTSGQVLTTDGAGNFSFTTVTGGGGGGGGLNVGETFVTRTYTGNGTTTAYNVTVGVTVHSLIVTIQGVVQTPTVDYTVSGDTLTFVEAPETGTVIQIRELAQSNTIQSLEIVSDDFIGDGVTTTFTLSAAPSSDDYTVVNVEGVFQTRGDSYTISGSSITFDTPPENLADIQVTTFVKTISNVYAISTEITTLKIPGGTAGQFITTDGNGNLSFTNVPSINSINDISDVAITTPEAGQVLAYDGTNWINQAIAGGASVVVAETAPAEPSAGDLWFDSTTLDLFIYYVDGDSSQWIQIGGSGGAGGAAANPYKEVTTAYTAAAGEKLFVDCSTAPVTVTLPAAPTLGTEVTIIDATGTANTNNITVARNGSKILGADENLTIDINDSAITLAYYNTARGWVLVGK